MAVGKWVCYLVYNGVLNCFANGFGDFLDFWNTIDQVYSMALLNWNDGFYNNWGIQAVFRNNFVARSGDGFMVSSVCNWSSNWSSNWSNGCVVESVESIKFAFTALLGFTFVNDMCCGKGGGSNASAVLASNLYALLFVFDVLSSDILGFTNMIDSWSTDLGLNFIMFNLAVWCKS